MILPPFRLAFVTKPPLEFLQAVDRRVGPLDEVDRLGLDWPPRPAFIVPVELVQDSKNNEHYQERWKKCSRLKLWIITKHPSFVNCLDDLTVHMGTEKSLREMASL